MDENYLELLKLMRAYSLRAYSPHLFHWQPTMKLRFVWRWEPAGEGTERKVRVLQQEWIETVDGTATGEAQWRDVPLVEGEE